MFSVFLAPQYNICLNSQPAPNMIEMQPWNTLSDPPLKLLCLLWCPSKHLAIFSMPIVGDVSVHVAGSAACGKKYLFAPSI